MLGSLLFTTIRLFFRVLTFFIIARALLSWFRPQGYNKLYHDIERGLELLTDPVMDPIRRVLPPVGPGIDFTPLVAIFLLSIIESLTLMLLRIIF